MLFLKACSNFKNPLKAETKLKQGLDLAKSENLGKNCNFLDVIFSEIHTPALSLVFRLRVKSVSPFSGIISFKSPFRVKKKMASSLVTNAIHHPCLNPLSGRFLLKENFLWESK